MLAFSIIIGLTKRDQNIWYQEVTHIPTVQCLYSLVTYWTLWTHFQVYMYFYGFKAIMSKPCCVSQGLSAPSLQDYIEI